MNAEYRSFFLLLCLAVVGSLAAPAVAAPVKVQESEIVIPTYPMGPQDPNPPFALVNSRDVYPYAMLDDLTNRLEPKKYRAIVLENEFLRATILPDLGARLYSLYDKVDHREVFYCNHVVKYGLIGLRGAWISGGIEFNFPNGHTTDTVSPVSSSYRRNADGSATVVIGDLDQVSEMYWQVELTLRPGVAALEERVTLFNPTPFSNLYWFWDNAAVAASDDLHYIYPMREVSPDEPGIYWSYPVWKGRDYSQYKNIREPTEIFGVGVHRNFYGVYYTKSAYGIVHHADDREMTGKKIWSWGVSGEGAIWTGLLTDHDGPYSEVQAGRFATQLSRESMMPQDVESWTENWYPVRKLGDGFVEAAKQLALNVQFSAERQHGGTMQILLSPVEKVEDARIEVRLKGSLLRTIGPLTLEPLATQSFSIPLSDAQKAKQSVEVKVLDSSGKILLQWSAAEPIDGNPHFVSRVGVSEPQPIPEDKLNADGLILRAEEKAKEGDDAASEQLYSQALKHDPESIPALRHMTVEDYRAADFTAASAEIGRAIAEDDSDAESQYLAGIVDRAQGRLFAAKDAFWIAVRRGKMRPESLMQLGEIAIAEGDDGWAERLLRQGLDEDRHDARMKSDLAVALRHEGKLKEARETISDVCSEMPLYPLALAEQRELADAKANEEPAEKKQAEQQWRRAAGDWEQNDLEAAVWYEDLHDWQAADFILKAAIEETPRMEVSAMVDYHLAFDALKAGQENAARAYAAKARAARYEGVFISRPEDAIVLKEAIRADPSDAHAEYLLGNFYFEYGRYADANRLWQAAKDSGFAYSVLDRNLGVYAWKIDGNLAQAADLYQQAIRLAPHDFHLYADLDQILTAMGDTKARSAMFASAPEDVLEQDPVRVRYILLLLQKGEPDRALGLMQGHNFRPWEGGQNIHDLFAYACIEESRKELAQRRYATAEVNIERSLTYPENLGVGKPDDPDDSAGLYWLGLAEKKSGDSSRADDTWKKLLEHIGGGKLAGYYQALALKQLGETAKADALLTQLAEAPYRPGSKEEGNATSYYAAGMAEQHRGQVRQATTDLQKALSLAPSLWQAQLELARLNP